MPVSAPQPLHAPTRRVLSIAFDWTPLGGWGAPVAARVTDITVMRDMSTAALHWKVSSSPPHRSFTPSPPRFVGTDLVSVRPAGRALAPHAHASARTPYRPTLPSNLSRTPSEIAFGATSKACSCLLNATRR
jgi:hypothetical protein